MSSIKKLFVVRFFAVCLALVVFPLRESQALNDCQFRKTSSTHYLLNDCTTDEPFFVPNKVTFNGTFHTITVVDPIGGNFEGAVIKANGASAKIYNVNIVTNLADFCPPGGELVGLLFENGFGGAVDRVNLTINRGLASTCDQGVGIEVRKDFPPVPGGKAAKVTIKRTNITNTQLAGIRALGFVNVPMDSVNITGYGPTAALAQTGVLFANGAIGTFVKGTVINHVHEPMNDQPAAGILLSYAGRGVKIDQSSIRVNDRGIHAFGGNSITISKNRVVDSTLDGIKLEDVVGLPVTFSKITDNESSKNLLNGIYLHQNAVGGMFKTQIKSNLVTRNHADGILVEGDSNKLHLNTLNLNHGVDIRNLGIQTYFVLNVCTSSFGPNVDCPVAP